MSLHHSYKFRIIADAIKRGIQINRIYRIFGSLTNWDIYDESRMNYDYQRSRYHAELYLKQGFYNYKYIFVEDGASIFDEAIIEGNYYETENDTGEPRRCSSNAHAYILGRTFSPS